MKNSRQAVYERQAQILDFLKKKQFATVSDLAMYLNVSPATIRRDLVALRDSGDLKKHYGGVGLLNNSAILPNFDEERFTRTNTHEKDIIAMHAASMIDNGDSVFLNSSSTALRVIPNTTVKNALFITNNGNTLTVPRNMGIELLLLGGEVGNASQSNFRKMSITGNFTLENIKKISANKCILGVSGISASGGLTSMSTQEVAVNSSMIAQCHGPVIIVADHRKVGIQHNFHFANINDITILITDSGSDPDELDKIRQAGVNVIVVETFKD